MYYRAADFYLHGNPDDPRILEAWQKSRDSFRRGAALLDQPVETVRIPYEQTTLPGYIFKPDQSDRPRKTLIIQTGFDGTAEELYFTNAVFALQRGYNVVDLRRGRARAGPSATSIFIFGRTGKKW